jgi:UDP-N-acetylglucosamine diphosphorylase/glucosamine-1-phosphate N-acetyltransferase
LTRYAIVLAAGRGVRLWPLTSTRPKPLLPLPGGETILSRVISAVRSHVDGLVVVVSRDAYGDMVRRHVESLGVDARFAVQEEPRGTGDAVAAALRALPKTADELLIVYGDLVFEKGIIDTLASAGAPSVAAVKVSNPWEYGVLQADEKGCLRAVREKPRDARPGSPINAGIYLLERSDVEAHIEDMRVSPRGELEFTDVISAIASEKCVKVVSDGWRWLDAGRPWDLFEAYRLVWMERFGGVKEPIIEGEVEGNVDIKGPVYVAPKAVVRSYTRIEGPAWIEGEVGPFARIRPWSFLLPGSKALTHVEVKASILMEGARAPHLNYVGDSIIGEEVNLGAGTITANLRFDHATIKMLLKGKLVDTGRTKLGAIIGGYAQTGINVSLLPGVRVGAYSWVYPGATIARDVPDCVLARPTADGVVYEPLSGRIACPSYLVERNS